MTLKKLADGKLACRHCRAFTTKRTSDSALTFYRGDAHHGFYIAGESFIGCPSFDGRLRYAD